MGLAVSQVRLLALTNRKADIELLKEIIVARPTNSGADITDIAIKIATVDITNSTHLSVQRNRVSLCELAEIIQDIPNIDSRLQKGDPTVVDDIARVEGQRRAKVDWFARHPAPILEGRHQCGKRQV